MARHLNSVRTVCGSSKPKPIGCSYCHYSEMSRLIKKVEVPTDHHHERGQIDQKIPGRLFNAL